MELTRLITDLLQNTQHSLWRFVPEIVLCLTIFLLLTVRLSAWAQRIPTFLLAAGGSAVALYFAEPWRLFGAGESMVREEIFTGMLVVDGFTVFMRSVLLVFAILLAVFTRVSRIPDEDDAIDFYCLVLGATLGMLLMSSANHLLMVFLAVEMASVPSYALAGHLKYRRESSEAALKYSVCGAGAAGVMLYGISLLAGVLHTAHIPTMALRLAQELPTFSAQELTVLVLSGLMIMVGLAFKLSAVPFHFWCPDVFEGATAEVNAFLSVSSKAAALALLVRVTLGLGVEPAGQTALAQRNVAPPAHAGLFAVADRVAPAAFEEGEAEASAPPARHDANARQMRPVVADNSAAESTAPGETAGAGGPLEPLRRFTALVVGVIAAITCTFGNLAAFGQTNMKRLMAYSTIAHAGYMMLPIPAAMAAAATYPEIAEQAVAGLCIYIAVYLLMNLSAFALVAFYRNSLGTEEIDDYAGLVRRSPVSVVMFAIVLFSLIGMPPLAGFLGKFAVFASLVEAYAATGQGFLIALLFVGAINTAVSLFYYVRVIKVMTIHPEPDHVAPGSYPVVSFMAGTFLLVLVVPIVSLIVYWNGLSELATNAARHLL